MLVCVLWYTWKSQGQPLLLVLSFFPYCLSQGLLFELHLPVTGEPVTLDLPPSRKYRRMLLYLA